MYELRKKKSLLFLRTKLLNFFTNRRAQKKKVSPLFENKVTKLFHRWKLGLRRKKNLLLRTKLPNFFTDGKAEKKKKVLFSRQTRQTFSQFENKVDKLFHRCTDSEEKKSILFREQTCQTFSLM